MVAFYLPGGLMDSSVLTVRILTAVFPHNINQRISLYVFYIQTRNLQLK